MTTRNFTNKEEFIHWKSDFERTSLSNYSTKTGAKVSQSADSHEQIRYYYCNRSGTYVPKGKRKRQLKVQGSAKLGHYCTSYIETRENVNTGGIVAEVCETHYGHSLYGIRYYYQSKGHC